MKIEFTGLLAAHKKKLISELIEFCLKKFLNEACIKQLEIIVEVKNSILIAGNLAEMYMNDDEFSFTIEIGNRQDFGKIMLSIAHECVHIKQYVMGEIEDIEDEKIVFLEKEYNTPEIDYWDWPWEIEAHGREHGLLLKYVESKNLQNEPWLKIFH